MIDELDPQQQLLDVVKSTAYHLGVIAECKETGGDYGQYEALLAMSLQLIKAVDAYEAEMERIDLGFSQGCKLAEALGITADELAQAIKRANGETADDTSA